MIKLAPHKLGTNAKGRAITTCVAVEAEPPAGAGKRRKLGSNEKVVFDALTAIIVDDPEPAPFAHDIPAHAKGASTERWRKAAARYLPQAEAKYQKRAFDRAALSLIASKLVSHVDGFVWIP